MGSTFITGAFCAMFSLGTQTNSKVKAKPYSTTRLAKAAQPPLLPGNDKPDGITPLAPATSMLENTISKVSRLRTAAHAGQFMVGDPQGAGKGTGGAEGQADPWHPVRVGRTAVGQACRHIQRQHQAAQDQAHEQHGAARGACAAQRPGEQRQQHREGVAHQQRQSHWNTRHRRVQAQALGGNQQAEQQLPPARTSGQGQGLALPQQQPGQYQEGDARAAEDGQQHAGAVIEGDARGDVVAGE